MVSDAAEAAGTRTAAETAAASAAASLRAGIERDRARIAAGERPVYHVHSSTSLDGSVDVRIAELPLIHLYVPDAEGIQDGARLILAETLRVDPGSFELREAAPAD